MTGTLLYEKLRDAKLVVPQMTDTEVIAMIERLEVEEMLAATPATPPGNCLECGGLDGRHYTDCSDWTGEQTISLRLRDQFAMAALTGMMASQSVEIKGDHGEAGVRALIHRYAELAYAQADKMLEARK